jgi:hypothetical protein
MIQSLHCSDVAFAFMSNTSEADIWVYDMYIIRLNKYRFLRI